MAASLVGAGAVQPDATAAHPSKQLGHGQATSQALGYQVTLEPLAE